MRVENMQLVENPMIIKRSNRPIRAELERNWNIAFCSRLSSNPPLTAWQFLSENGSPSSVHRC